MNSLTEAREEIVRWLTEDVGINAVSYTTTDIQPPCAIVLPKTNYIVSPSRDQKMGQWNIALSILLIASKGTDKRNAEELDGLLVNALLAMDEELDITDVGEPLTVTIRDNDYLGSIVSVNYQIKMERS